MESSTCSEKGDSFFPELKLVLDIPLHSPKSITCFTDTIVTTSRPFLGFSRNDNGVGKVTLLRGRSLYFELIGSLGNGFVCVYAGVVF